MNVRMIGGRDAGEIRNLPFIAARGAITSGLAVAIVAGAAQEREPVAVVAESEQESPLRGKRHGKRR